MKNNAAYIQIQTDLNSTALSLCESKRNLTELKHLLSTYKEKNNEKYEKALWNYKDMKASYKTLRKIRNIIYRKLFVLKLREFIK